MHGHTSHIDIDKVIKAGPFAFTSRYNSFSYLLMAIGAISLTVAFIQFPASYVWGVYYVNVIFWMGLALGGIITVAIYQIVRAKWSASIRRVGEANVAFLPYAFCLWAATYFGKEYLFPWARGPMPGREWWMQPNFVYIRFAVLFLFLFFMMTRFVRMSLRGDIGLARERNVTESWWKGLLYQGLTTGWKGAQKEIVPLQQKMSWNAPLLIVIYAIIYSLFAFEMVMAMDSEWYSNLFGGFYFVGNVYLGWAMSIILVVYLSKKNFEFNEHSRVDQLWDLGKLMFAFCMLWGYMFFGQFLVQWYGNLPEETQWMILRTREYPWKGLGWATFACAFVLPFILLLSDDLKKAPKAIVKVAMIVMLGVWLEKYMVVIPELFPAQIPFLSASFGLGFVEIGVSAGFLGLYLFSIAGFLSRYPVVPVSHPLLYGEDKW